MNFVEYDKLPKNKKAVIALSGGMDSTTLLYYCKEILNYDLTAVSFFYGQNHSKELELAKQICELNNIPHKLIDISFLGEITKGISSLTSGGDKIPEGRYDEDNMKSTVVPFRNGIILSTLAAFAEANECEVIVYGAHLGDFYQYPDTRPEFVKSMSEAIFNGTTNSVQMVAPFVNITKTDIVRNGVELKVPFELTWSCYKGGDRPCCKCMDEDVDILMEDFSTKKIKDLLIYDKILSWDRLTKKLVSNRVMELHNNGMQTIKDHVLDNNVILPCTPDHKVARYDSNNNVVFNKIKDFIKLKHNKIFYMGDKYKKNVVSNELDFWFGWIKGILDGDGYSSKIKNWPNQRSMGICVKSLEFINLIKNKFDELNIPYSEYDHIIKKEKNIINNLSGNDSHLTHIQITGKDKSNIIKELELKFDKYEEDLNLDYMKGWVRGIIDTDGNIDKGSYRISQSKPHIIEKIKLFLSELNISYCLRKKEIKGLKNKQGLNMNHDSYTFVLSNLSIINNNLGNIKTFKYNDGKLFGLNRFDKVRILSEDNERISQTYDITTECGNYIANGVLVHNCGTCSERTLSFIENGLTDPFLTGEEWEIAANYAREIYHEINA